MMFNLNLYAIHNRHNTCKKQYVIQLNNENIGMIEIFLNKEKGIMIAKTGFSFHTDYIMYKEDEILCTEIIKEFNNVLKKKISAKPILLTARSNSFNISTAANCGYVLSTKGWEKPDENFEHAP